MLRLILGRAKSGKTALIMNEISSILASGGGGIALIVPEQYSHEAEYELLSVCGDSLSLGAEVLSFTRLASRVDAELDGSGAKLLDGGGRLLCLALALNAVGSRLRLYSAARRQSELQRSLLSAIDEFKSALVSPGGLAEFARGRSDSLGLKLQDLALIYSAYDAIVKNGGLDPSDRLALLAEKLPRSSYARGTFFIDGFIDFTRQQEEVIRALLRGGARVTVCLTCDGLAESHEIFEPSRRAALRLQRLASSLGVGCGTELCADKGDGSAMDFLEAELFTFSENVFPGGAPVTLARAASLTAECEAAAAHCLSLVRESGCRWRDIAVAVRGFEGSRAAVENIFAHYGVPLYTAKRSDLMEKSIPTLISSAFEVIHGGWSYEDMFTYLRTGLAGLGVEECDRLENYVFLWSKRGTAWTSERGWGEHPDGWGREYTEETAEALREINRLRRLAADPLAALARRGAEADTASGQARALAAFFDDISLPLRLSERAEMLESEGLEQKAAEYVQLWDVVVTALEQCESMLGGAQMDQETFAKLFCLVLSQYDVGTIPLTLDKVTAGDMDRMRRRSIKHLVVLGCDSRSVPSIGEAAGLFSDDDREIMAAAGMFVGDTAAGRLSREFSLVYNCLTLPSESLYISYAAVSGEDGSAQPSFVMSRCSKIFGKDILPVSIDRCRMSARAPALQLASRGSPGDPLTLAARKYFSESGERERLQKILSSATVLRGKLSREAVRGLYGPRLRLSASRIDRFASCRFQYFLQYGLGAKPRQPAGFAPPEMGTFMHFVLEGVAREISGAGGFASASRETVEQLCDRYVERYISEKLNDFREKSPRFVYLFRRLTLSVRRVVLDTVAELARSDFRPLDFELSFGDAASVPPVELGSGDERLTLTGVADRVDGWLHDGKLYIRVVDYKTGKKKFSLSDVWYGLGLQMLLYLFALSRADGGRYGGRIVPAGVLYVPAHDVLVSASASLSDEAIAAEKMKGLRRSGLVLGDAEVLRAMEKSDSPLYIPVSFKNGGYTGDSLASAEQLGALARHIDSTLRALARELRAGSVCADPYFRTLSDNACAHCDYCEACLFDEERDTRRSLKKMKNDEIWQRLREGGEYDGL